MNKTIFNKLKDNLKKIYHIFDSFWKRIIFVFILVQVSSILESFGLALFFPLLKTISTPDVKDKGMVFEYISNYFPEKYILGIICGFIVVLVFLKFCFFIFRTWYSHRLILDIRKNWMTAIFHKYLNAKFSFLLGEKQGVLLHNLLSEPRKATKVMDLLVNFISKVFVSFYLYIILIFVNWQMTLIFTMVLFLIAVLVSTFLSRYSLKVGKLRIKYNQNISSTASEGILGFRQIRTFSLENKILQQFENQLSKLFKLNIQFRLINSIPLPLLELLIVVLTLGSLVTFVYIFQYSSLEIIPLIGLFVIVGQRLFSNAAFLMSHWMEILSSIPSLKLVYSHVKSYIPNEITDKGIAIETLKNDIVLRDVDFKYKNRKSLFNKINMKIPYGKNVALVGPSGSGKSTIADFILGFFIPEKGGVLINEKDINQIQLSSWRAKVGFVSQDTFIFNAPIRDNIIVGNLNASEDDMVLAAKKAYAHDFIMELPNGYDTIVGDRGMQISGGQRQRIAIARAIIRNPELYIFDEATSSLDNESEKIIWKSIEEIGKKKTVLIITHRQSTLRNIDLIYEINNKSINLKKDIP